VRAFFSAIRFPEWIHFLALPLAGLDHTGPVARELTSLARGIGIAFFVLAFGYLLNALADRDMDGDVSRYALVAGSNRPFPVTGLLWVLAALALGLSWLGPWPVRAAAAVSIASGWIYSAGPRLKSRPGIGSLLNVTNFAPLLLVGMSGPSLPRDLAALTVVFSALLLQNQMLHEAADAEYDRRGELRTTFLYFGRRPAAALAFVLGLAAWLGSVWMGSSVGVAAAAGAALLAFPSLAFYPIWLDRRGEDPVAMSRARGAHRKTSLVLGAMLCLTRFSGA
jgi:4-hydroxybenzoate polyprenyltransferase